MLCDGGCSRHSGHALMNELRLGFESFLAALTLVLLIYCLSLKADIEILKRDVKVLKDRVDKNDESIEKLNG